MLLFKVDENENNFDYKITFVKTNEIVDKGQCNKFGDVIDILYNLQFKFGFNNVEMIRGWVD